MTIIRLPYEVVNIAVEKIWWEAISNDMDMFEANHLTIELIEACGWTGKEYDQETIKRVDKGWGVDQQSN